jgi:glyoxylase-like metal-dependent hydrolase (beta-lactamase superfamily II)/rhodanese-related sulfurtransferase
MDPRLEISAEKLRLLLEREQAVTVLDVRPRDEREEWSIPGSRYVDAYKSLWARDPQALADVDLPLGVPVITVCAAGRTSLIAAEQLRSRGFAARSLHGGMRAWSLAWNTAGVPLNKSQARVVQVRRTGKGCLSYVIGSEDEAAVLDASLAPRVYLEIAGAHGWRITHVLDTHVHADHLSRSRKLARLAGATLHMPAQDRVSYAFTAVRDGDTIRAGHFTLRALRTPGHTGESTCYLLDEEALLTGDTLFLDSIGRPDLAGAASGEVAPAARAHALYHSLLKVTSLPPQTLVLPGHTGQPVPFDGQPLGATLGKIRREVPVLAELEDAFVAGVLARIPPPPPNYPTIVELNEAGLFPRGDPAGLEAGANRCAIS